MFRLAAVGAIVAAVVLWAAAFVFVPWGCQSDVYPPFMGDGGPPTGGSTVIGGNSHPDLSVQSDGGVPSQVAGVIVAHSGSPSRVSATFDGCPTTTISGCRFRDCAPPDMAVGSYDVNVGNIRVMSPTADVTLTPQANGFYLPLTVATPLWGLAGAKVNLTGTGADYPPFMTTLDGPTTITVTNPLAGAIDVPRTADLDVSWTDGTTGHVTVEIAAGAQTLACDFALAAGTGVVPHQALSMLTAGAATLTVVVASTTVVDGVITVSTEIAGVDSVGQPFVANVNLK
jgi:hypothetical protein